MRHKLVLLILAHATVTIYAKKPSAEVAAQVAPWNQLAFVGSHGFWLYQMPKEIGDPEIAHHVDALDTVRVDTILRNVEAGVREANKNWPSQS